MISPALRMDTWQAPALPAVAPPSAAPRRSARNYVAARLGGQNIIGSLQSKDAEVRKDLYAVRRNSRLIANNNPFMRRYIRTIGGQVVGPGVTFQSKAPEALAKKIEAAWAAWGRKGSCTSCGKYSWVEVQRLFLRTMALDGEAFLRLVPDKRNPFGLSLQFLDADLLDHTFSRPAGQGANAVVMGVELDLMGRPVAYWFSDPGSVNSVYNRGAKIRILASEIIHGMDPERVNQTRGMPWTSSAMFLLDMLGHYWESEVAAARHEAERQGFLLSETGDPDAPADDEDDLAPTTNELADQASGSIRYMGLPPGMKVDIPEVQHPTTAFGEFSKAMLKGIASGAGISYASLASDLTEVSYSSIRQGTLDDREYYRELQQLLIETLCERVFPAWLTMALLTGAITAPGVTWETAAACAWEPRGWDWVDPKADSESKINTVNAALDTRTRIFAERGLNFKEAVQTLAEEDKLLKELGLKAEPKSPVTVNLGGETAGQPAVDGSAKVQDTALNGAQVASLLAILVAVAEGELPKEAAKAALVASFPGITPEAVAAMVDPITVSKKEPKEPAPPMNPKGDANASGDA